MVTAPPGPEAKRAAGDLDRFEAPGVNTLVGGETACLWTEALGANVLDTDGNRYLDLTAGFGVAAIGHRHPRVVTAVKEQSERLLHGLGDVFAHPARIALARRLAALAPVLCPRIYFAISGSDAVEVALKTALLATQRSGVLAFDPAYHGLTLGALAATSRPAFREPFSSHLHPHLERHPFAAPLARLRSRLERGEHAACLVEPIVGREGVLLPPEGWLAELAEACRACGTLLVLDEIFTGFGRTGAWFVAVDEGVEPDLLCCGKALGGGLPIAAAIGRAPLMDSWQSEGEARHTATFVAHPLACAAALATLEVLEEESLVARSRRLGRRVESALAPCLSSPQVRELRGRGLLWGLEMAAAEDAERLQARALEHGLLLLAGGPRGRVLQLCPPLSISEEQLDWACEQLVALVAELSPAGRAGAPSPPGRGSG